MSHMTAEEWWDRGLASERRRIRKEQAHALRNIRVLIIQDAPCSADLGFPGCKRGGKHAEDCTRGILVDSVRALANATREPR